MRSIVRLTTFLCLSISLLVSQKLTSDKVPAAVAAAFSKQFPTAVDPKWEMEGTDYEVNFRVGKGAVSANFDPAGALLKTEESVSASALPKAVKESLKKEFPGFKIEQTEKVTKKGDDTLYEIELEKKEKTIEVLISSEGKIISQKAEDEGTEKEKENEKEEN